jgi:hypothetical protein
MLVKVGSVDRPQLWVGPWKILQECNSHVHVSACLDVIVCARQKNCWSQSGQQLPLSSDTP